MPEIGGAVWKALWEAARRYSSQIAYAGHPFPPETEGAKCVLCQQELGADAKERMSRFEQFSFSTMQRDGVVQRRLARGTRSDGATSPTSRSWPSCARAKPAGR
jgi:hypothetical protein